MIKAKSLESASLSSIHDPRVVGVNWSTCANAVPDAESQVFNVLKSLERTHSRGFGS